MIAGEPALWRFGQTAQAPEGMGQDLGRCRRLSQLAWPPWACTRRWRNARTSSTPPSARCWSGPCRARAPAAVSGGSPGAGGEPARRRWVPDQGRADGALVGRGPGPGSARCARWAAPDRPVHNRAVFATPDRGHPSAGLLSVEPIVRAITVSRRNSHGATSRRHHGLSGMAGAARRSRSTQRQ